MLSKLQNDGSIGRKRSGIYTSEFEEEKQPPEEYLPDSEVDDHLNVVPVYGRFQC